MSTSEDCGCKGTTAVPAPTTQVYLKSIGQSGQRVLGEALDFTQTQIETVVGFVKSRGECLVYEGSYLSAIAVIDKLSTDDTIVVEGRNKSVIGK